MSLRKRAIFERECKLGARRRLPADGFDACIEIACVDGVDVSYLRFEIAAANAVLFRDLIRVKAFCPVGAAKLAHVIHLIKIMLRALQPVSETRSLRHLGCDIT
jgi:hypothetical protein